MEKRTEVPLHLYIGCECETDSGIRGKLITLNDEAKLCAIRINPALGQTLSMPYSELKLVLRKLDSMTEEERNWIWQFEPGYDSMPFLESLKVDAGITNYLLSKGFDLFGLIESGLAIDLLPSNLAIDKNK